MRTLRSVVLLAGLAALCGCSAVYGTYSPNGGGPYHTMSGTITLTNLNASGYAVVTATMASYPYSASVSEPTPVSGLQAVSYILANLQAGTYRVMVTVTTAKAAATSGSYAVNMGTAVADMPAVSGGPAYDWTMTISSLPVSTNVQLDAAMQ